MCYNLGTDFNVIKNQNMYSFLLKYVNKKKSKCVKVV